MIRNDPSNKWAESSNNFHQEDMQMYINHLKRFSVSLLIIREMKIKTTRYNSISTRMNTII